MTEIGAWVLRSDTELLRKSRRAVPQRLLDAGFTVDHPAWPGAADPGDMQRSPWAGQITLSGPTIWVHCMSPGPPPLLSLADGRGAVR